MFNLVILPWVTINKYLLTAGVLCFILGLSHSILGKILIFKNKKENKKIVPTIVTSNLKEDHLSIIWVTWHLTSIFGWFIAAILIKIAINHTEVGADFMQFILISITISMCCASFLVYYGTKGKHPGWLFLLIIGFLTAVEVFN